MNTYALQKYEADQHVCSHIRADLHQGCVMQALERLEEILDPQVKQEMLEVIREYEFI